jgi:hypothetical protein
MGIKKWTKSYHMPPATQPLRWSPDELYCIFSFSQRSKQFKKHAGEAKSFKNSHVLKLHHHHRDNGRVRRIDAE